MEQQKSKKWIWIVIVVIIAAAGLVYWVGNKKAPSYPSAGQGGVTDVNQQLGVQSEEGDDTTAGIEQGLNNIEIGDPAKELQQLEGDLNSL